MDLQIPVNLNPDPSQIVFTYKKKNNDKAADLKTQQQNRMRHNPDTATLNYLLYGKTKCSSSRRQAAWLPRCSSSRRQAAWLPRCPATWWSLCRGVGWRCRAPADWSRGLATPSWTPARTSQFFSQIFQKCSKANKATLTRDSYLVRNILYCCYEHLQIVLASGTRRKAQKFWLLIFIKNTATAPRWKHQLSQDQWS